MANYDYTEEELDRYFNDPSVRRGKAKKNGKKGGRSNGSAPKRRQKGYRAFVYRRFKDPAKGQAAYAISLIAGFVLLCALALGVYMWTLTDDLPGIKALENPDLQLATVAYTADGEELQRYAFQNRTSVGFEDISPHVIHALISTEDRRFYDHWGMDLLRTFSSVFQTILSKAHVPGFHTQGGSTITQQLARNLYNEQIGREQTLSRKLKEWVTAVELERRYTKREILVMYLNTIEYVYNAFGIEAASRTFFSKPAKDLNPMEAATLVGMLQNPSRFNPIRFPDRSKARRNTVLMLMVKQGFLSRDFYAEHHDEPIETHFNSSEITQGIAPYFAEYVRNWLNDWAEQNDRNIYEDGLVVYTTLDSRLQKEAEAAVQEQMEGLQAVVDYSWSKRSGYSLGGEVGPYLKATGYKPFEYFWKSKRSLVNSFIKETAAFRSLRDDGMSSSAALKQLQGNENFMDSLKTAKTRLETGMLGIDPHTGFVKIWVGGRDLSTDWYDHVATAKRQPGSTFKPFVYTAAIDNGYSPNYMLPDSTFTYTDPNTGEVWQPDNMGGEGGMMTLAQALATSNNNITARLMAQIGPSTAAFYAHRMGIKSHLDEVMSLALGVSDVSLLELTAAYSTLADGGLYHEPTVVTRIEDRFGNVLYEAEPVPEEALSEQTAYTVVDMMRGGVQYGTGIRIRTQFGITDYDLASKTGTTQNSADTWFMLMHPDLVTGAWVGFNDRRVSFRSTWWGQGAHTALLLVGDFFKRAAQLPESPIDKSKRFPSPIEYGAPDTVLQPTGPTGEPQESNGGQDQGADRVGW
ncbi:MAG TPA: transglycosylase domain-containing protein [Rhodothermales bacterium]|nr:transglycosylase domain-containing protein [Rhodothermales bacterium]